MDESRLQQQIRFLLEMDKLKAVLRRTSPVGMERMENSAEHSWHVALMAIVLAEHAAEKIDVCRVIKMMLVHDVIEIDAGDTYIYDVKGNEDKAAREREAADRIFGLLPSEQAAELDQLWSEFEERKTAEARFARGLDRLMPMLHNYHNQGKAWRKHGITSKQILQTNSIIADGAPDLWTLAQQLVQDALQNGFIES